MTTRTQKYSNRFPKKRNVIDLTDTARRNHTPVVRNLDINPVTGARIYANTTSAEDRSLFRDPEKNSQAGPTFIMAGEDKGQASPEPYIPEDPEPQYEEGLEATRATIIKSETYYPASKTTITKRSMTPQEIADERGYSIFP